MYSDKLDQNIMTLNSKVILQKILQNEMHNNKLQLKDQRNIITLLYSEIVLKKNMKVINGEVKSQLIYSLFLSLSES